MLRLELIAHPPFMKEGGTRAGQMDPVNGKFYRAP